MERHCARVFLIASELARRSGRELDRELTLCAAWLHDAGLYPGAASDEPYVVDGRRLAERVLSGHSWDGERLRRCGDAIERHHELRRQWRHGTEVELVRRADLVEVSGWRIRFGLDRDWLRGLERDLPRAGLYGEIGRLVRRALRERPATLPRILLR